MKKVTGDTVTVTTKRTHKITWVAKSIEFNKKFRETRERIGRPINSCWVCGRKFEYGEHMYLCGVKRHKNVVMCKDCAEPILKSLEGK